MFLTRRRRRIEMARLANDAITRGRAPPADTYLGNSAKGSFVRCSRHMERSGASGEERVNPQLEPHLG